MLPAAAVAGAAALFRQGPGGTEDEAVHAAHTPPAGQAADAVTGGGSAGGVDGAFAPQDVDLDLPVIVQAEDAEPDAPDTSNEQGVQAEQQRQHRPLQQTFEAMKLGSQRLASMITPRAKELAPAPAPLSAGAGPVQARTDAPLQQQGQEHTASEGCARGVGVGATLLGLGAAARQTSWSMFSTAAEGLKWLATGDPLLALCRSEPPVPQLVLACCTALVAGGGIRAEGIFKAEVSAEEVEAYSMVAAGGRPALIPPGTNPHVLVALIKRFLIGLDEPLLTYRLLPDWIIAAGELSEVGAVASRLPPASANVLRLLLEVCHLVDANAASSEMDSWALAQALAPCVAWLPPSLKPQKPLGAPGSVGADAASAATVTGAQALQEAGCATASVAEQRVARAGASSGGGSGGSDHIGGGDMRPVAVADGMVPLEGAEAQAIVVVVHAMISRFRELF